ncbi:hypothetical protein [Steroidobacter sp.]|uniref:hypothetical protein n=1 Tax=Steroidobacter sp. TaxID=1978227 RepID=UPI001A4FA2A9|nr:hypothetical protein [Steroidobacter sp.]MBL8270421.1 hypothetical protein [Steroidobacter sp.]
MRTLIIIVIGLAIAAAVMRFVPVAHRLLAAGVFTAAWLVVTILNLKTGLSHGYTLAEELPIHSVLFGVPVVAAWLWIWWAGR